MSNEIKGIKARLKNKEVKAIILDKKVPEEELGCGLNHVARVIGSYFNSEEEADQSV